MNFGLIGAGYWGTNILRNLKINNQINKIYILDLKKNDFKKNEKITFFSSEKEFFSKYKEIDAFIITTPTSSHNHFIKKCLNLNKFVCITKPVTKNLSELNLLKKNFSNINKIFLDHTYLYHSSIRFIKKNLNKNIIGKLIYYDSERISFGKFYKDVDVVDDLAIHDLYILDYFLDGEIPNKVLISSHSGIGNKNFMSNITLKYKSGFFANIKVSWYSPIKSRRILIAGEKKIIEFDDNESDKKIKIYNKGIEFMNNKNINQWLYRTGSIEIPNILHSESLTLMINDFIKFCKNNKKNLNIFNHAQRVMTVLDKIKKQI